ncbi:Intramembrane protease RasP/YluC, implicated in cell division based on FtsL cleavage, partial [hydrothermal vent metagenome]
MELQSLLIFPITIAAFLALLMIIVFIHEYGHFSMARLLGVRVDVFSIGFGKPILRWVDRKGTEWRIAALPLGGYVKFFGDLNAASQASPEVAKASAPATTQFPKPGDAEEVGQGMTAEERAVCFHFKPVWARAAIVAAGPVANFILAVAIFASLFAAFGRQYAEPVVGSVLEASAAQEAGVLPGDRIVVVNGRSIDKFRQIQDAVSLSSGDALEVTVLRGGGEVELTIVPTRAEIEDRYGNPIEVWQLGIGGDPNAYGFE